MLLPLTCMMSKVLHCAILQCVPFAFTAAQVAPSVEQHVPFAAPLSPARRRGAVGSPTPTVGVAAPIPSVPRNTTRIPTPSADSGASLKVGDPMTIDSVSVLRVRGAGTTAVTGVTARRGVKTRT